VITINDQNFNFFNGHSWALKVFKALDENKDELDLESASEEEEGKEGDKRHISFYYINSVKCISWTSRQLIQCY